MKKSSLITIFVILAVVVLAIWIITREHPNVDEETAKCIGENSVLYVREGCYACEIQEDMFGENSKHLNIIDCFYEREKCIEKGITATPTWEINSQFYKGVQSIEKLKELTGC